MAFTPSRGLTVDRVYLQVGAESIGGRPLHPGYHFLPRPRNARSSELWDGLQDRTKEPTLLIPLRFHIGRLADVGAVL